MKLALVGTGQMGRAVASLAESDGHEVVARFNTRQPLAEASGPEALCGAEVVIDFSLPSVVMGHLGRYCQWRQPAVVGTTGWYEHLPTVRTWVEAHQAAVLYAPNFSLGVALLAEALHGLLPMLERLPDFDVFVHEIHHLRKADSPSGTALMLGQRLVDGLSRKTHIEAETQHQRIDPAALHVTATRAGGVFGHHTLGIDGPFDRLTFTHEAQSRQGFAYGALRAAEWLPGHTGLFTLNDMLADG